MKRRKERVTFTFTRSWVTRDRGVLVSTRTGIRGGLSSSTTRLMERKCAATLMCDWRRLVLKESRQAGRHVDFSVSRQPHAHSYSVAEAPLIMICVVVTITLPTPLLLRLWLELPLGVCQSSNQCVPLIFSSFIIIIILDRTVMRSPVVHNIIIQVVYYMSFEMRSLERREVHRGTWWNFLTQSVYFQFIKKKQKPLKYLTGSGGLRLTSILECRSNLIYKTHSKII